MTLGRLTADAPSLDATLTPEALAADGQVRAAALFRLRIFLIAVGLSELERRREQLDALSSAEAARLVRGAAETACAAILTCLDDYRGQSRFAVWVAKFAIHEAAATTREIAAGRRKAKAAGDTNPPATCAAKEESVSAIEGPPDGKRATDD